MTNPATDELARVCGQLQNGAPERAALERALVLLCENAAAQEDALAALTTALRDNAVRARALQAQIQNRAGARAA